MNFDYFRLIGILNARNPGIIRHRFDSFYFLKMVNQTFQLRYFLSFVTKLQIISNVTDYVPDHLLQVLFHFLQWLLGHQVELNLLCIKENPVEQFYLKTGVLRVSQAVFQ